MDRESSSKRFSHNSSGATAVEYALIAAGIAVVIVGAIALAGGSLQNTFGTIGGSL
ncbi:MAG: Flp family type IVb pilin [Alphaproteobacteria bacterium]|jgi:pilus assembly protein Flp/PilA